LQIAQATRQDFAPGPDEFYLRSTQRFAQSRYVRHQHPFHDTCSGSQGDLERLAGAVPGEIVQLNEVPPSQTRQYHTGIGQCDPPTAPPGEACAKKGFEFPELAAEKTDPRRVAVRRGGERTRLGNETKGTEPIEREAALGEQRGILVHRVNIVMQAPLFAERRPPQISRMKNDSFDLIGDIHGEAASLRDLLIRLGYRERAGCYRHPQRRVIFLGDYVDRGPAIRETLQLIRDMVEHGAATALCGNHELDILMHDTPDERGGWLRPRGGRESAMHSRTHAEFADRPDEWRDWLRWFQTLPLLLELPGLRAVHACWDEAQVAVIRDRRLDGPLLHAIADKSTRESSAVHRLLKGPEVPLPDGIRVRGREESSLARMRVRWWRDGRGETYRDACINRHEPGPEIPIPSEFNALLTPPRVDQCPVFIGHYWMPPEHPAPLTPKLACLDYSVAAGGPLVAYRWDGECALRSDKFVFDPTRLHSGRQDSPKHFIDKECSPVT